MSEAIRYKPDPAVRWLQIGAGGMRKHAHHQGSQVLKREGARSLGKDVAQAAGALVGAGKSAVAELKHLALQATEYALFDDRFEVIRSTGIRSISYAEVRSATRVNDDVNFILSRGSLTISPPAYVQSGPVRAIIGWERNGIEVAYELLIEEICARSGIDLDLG
jgi:hypothetical protein